MFKDFKENVDRMIENMGNLSRETETIKENEGTF